jgi:hypothetical protein
MFDMSLDAALGIITATGLLVWLCLLLFVIADLARDHRGHSATDQQCTLRLMSTWARCSMRVSAFETSPHRPGRGPYQTLSFRA